MAATASFKQQCPSCEAWVPIRDPNLIGRKIDCPKCKYRFVVEDPGTEADDEEETESSGKKPGRDNGAKRAADGKGTAVKGKGGPRRRDEDDGEDEGKAARRKGTSGGSTKLILGLGIGVVAVGADNMAWDVPDERDPETGATLFAHAYLLPQKGIYIMENLYLEELARDRRYVFAFIGIPLKFRGATGSPLRPLALGEAMTR